MNRADTTRRVQIRCSASGLAESLILALLLSYSSARGGVGGSVSGAVVDPSGMIIPDVKVIIRNVETQVSQTTVTNGNGLYAFPFLPSGHYEIEVAHPGFKPYRRTGLEVTLNSALRIDVSLTLGPHNEAITVTESSTQVERASTQMGELIPGKEMTSIPVNGRSYTDLLALQPGVIPASSKQPNAVAMSGCATAPPSGDLNPGDLSVSGQRETANGFVVNGGSVQEDFNMFAAIVPNLDSIQEFRVLTNDLDAEYGNVSGGQIIVTTKSGTNQIHGSGFDFLRNTNLDARNYFALDRAMYDRNQFGGTVGGPIRKSRTFFFADYQGTRMTRGVDTGLISVPSVSNRLGNFSDIAKTLTGTVHGQYWADRLSEKLGYAVSPGESYYTEGCVTSGQCVLPNAQIPQNAWSTPARNMLQYIPEPNQGASTFSTSAYNQTLRDDKGAIKIDHPTPWGSLSAYYFWDDYSFDNPYPTAQAGANVPGFNALTLGRAQLATFGLTSTLGSNAVNELRLSYMRTRNHIGKPVGGVGPSLVSQGFVDAEGNPTIVPLAPQIEGVENIAFNDFTIGVDITGVVQANNTYQWTDNISRVIGKHMLKFGADLHYDQINIAPDATYNGSFTFQGTETGSDFADYLLGIASVYAQGDSNNFYPRDKYAGLYGQDQWQLRPGLTVNYGLRWDLLPPWREKYNQIQTVVLGQQSVVYPGAPTGLVFPGDPGIPDTLAPAKHSNFAPRIGLAWSPNSTNGVLSKLFGAAQETSVRAGYGLFYTAIEGLSAGIMSANPPYGLDFDSSGPPLFENPFLIAATGENVGQRFPSPIASPGASREHPDTAVDWSKYLPIEGVPAFFPENVTPYSENYMLSVQRQLWRAAVLSLSYVGTQSHHLLVLTSANPGNPALCLELSQPESVMAGTPTCGPFGENNVYTAAGGQVIEGTRAPFNSNFAGFTYQKTIGNSNYNALEVSLRHTSPRTDFLLGYTYSKSLDQSSSLSEEINPFDQHLSKALSAFDLRHNFVASYNLKLPFERLLRRQNRWTEGWSVSGITRFSTGLPVTLFNNQDTSLAGTIPNGINDDGVDTPDHTPGKLSVNTNPRNGKPAFNTSLFSLPELGTLGTAARRFFYGPGMANFDMALRKSLRLSESRSLEFRVEAFNVFNHAQFFGAAAVNGNISSAAFGEVMSATDPRLLQGAAKFYF